MARNRQQQMLLSRAEQYCQLGYKVGLALGKKFLVEYSKPPSSIWNLPDSIKTPDHFDGISLMLSNLICVDFDTPDLNVGYHYLPPTLKERTPHGYHLFYLIAGFARFNKMSPKIKWQPNVDLLVNESAEAEGLFDDKVKTVYEGRKDEKQDHPFGSHALISPTNGYTRIYPDDLPVVNSLTVAPDWLIEAVSK